MSESLEILGATDAFMDFCDPAETENLEEYFAEAGPTFITWLQARLLKAINESWDPQSFTRQRFGDMVLRSNKDGATYSVRVTVSMPDPFVADQLDGYPVTVSFEKRELQFQHPQPAALVPASFGNRGLRGVRGLEALPEGESETSNSGS